MKTEGIKWATVGLFVVSGLLWLLARFAGVDFLSGWAFVMSYAALAVGLALAPGVSGALVAPVRLLGLGFLFLALGELGWLTLFADGATGGNVLLPNLPYYASNVVFSVAVVRIYNTGQNVFGFPSRWLWLSAAFALAVVAGLSAFNFDPTALSFSFWTDFFNSVMGAFVTILIVCTALLTLGGSWSSWMIPLAIGFGLRMAGDIYYTLTASTYAYGSLADWLWLLGSTAICLVVLRGQEDAEVFEDHFAEQDTFAAD